MKMNFISCLLHEYHHHHRDTPLNLSQSIEEEKEMGKKSFNFYILKSFLKKKLAYPNLLTPIKPIISSILGSEE